MCVCVWVGGGGGGVRVREMEGSSADESNKKLCFYNRINVVGA